MRSGKSCALNKPAGLIQTPLGLFEELKSSGIRYCAWKSTRDLEKALRGGTDLDLLVDREDCGALFGNWPSAVISSRSCRRPSVNIRRSRTISASTRGLAPSPISMCIIDSLSATSTPKHYVLPFEQPFLEHTLSKLGMPIPAPELEIIVLVLRTLIKYRDVVPCVT